jgi:hypothetical protein
MEAYGIKNIEFTDLRGHADFVVRHRERDQTSKTTESRTESTETIFEESISLETDGYVYHPNIMEFTLGGVYGLVQEEFEDVVDGDKRATTQSGDLTEFDMDLLLFKKRPFPLTVFAHRNRGLIPRPFLPSLETTTTSYGFTWQYVHEKTPVSLQFTHTDAKLTPLFVARSIDPEEEGRQENTEVRLKIDHHFSDRSTLHMTYEHESVDEKPFELDYDADELTLAHNWQFGPKRQHTLRSELNVLDQRGTITIKRVRWREDLRLKHSGSLRSFFQFEALDRERGGRSDEVPVVDERSLYFSAMLRHQLYLSLTSQIRAFVRHQQFEPDLDVTRWSGQANFKYRKTNRWGVLHANYGIRGERNDQQGSEQTREIIEETHTFRDPDPITLGSRNVVPGSITVRAEDRVTYYHRGFDYSVRTIGNSVEISRLTGGRIVDGETVLVDYLFNVGGTFQLDTVGQNFGVRQDFDFGLTPYYRFEWQDQTLSPARAAGAIAEDITGHTAGVEYRKASLRMFAEYEDRDSTINPLESTRAGASYVHRYKSGAQSSVHARWTDTTHREPNPRDVRLLTVEGRHRHPITPTLTVEGAVLYRDGEDSVSDDTEGVEVSLSMEWYVRDTKVELRLEHNDFEDEFTRNESSALFVHVRREIR